MKTTLLSAFAAFGTLTLISPCPAPAQTRPADRPRVESSPDTTSHEKLQVAPPEAMERSVRKLAGQTVYGANGEKLGTIKDFVVDKKTGRVVYAVISTGGMLGVGDTLRLVPLHALEPTPDGAPGYKVRVSRASWDQSPSLISEAFSAGIVTLTADQEQSVAELFGNLKNENARPHRDTANVATAGAAPLNREAARAASPWLRATDLRGKDLHAAGQEVGEIEEIVIDLRRQTATALVELDDDILGHDRRVLVPLSEISLATRSGKDAFATTLTRNDFANLDPAHRTRADANLLPTGRTNAPSPAVSSPEATLASATRSARQALDNHAELSRADIRVTAENGMLILRGRVQNAKLKELAEDAVENAASGIRLQNYLIIDPR